MTVAFILIAGVHAVHENGSVFCLISECLFQKKFDFRIPDRTAFLLVDVSASVNEEETLRLAREALEKSGGRQTGVIAFGGNAAVERPLGKTGPLGDLTARVDRSASDLNRALQLASALLPADSNGGIAVISDGRVTGEEDFFRSAGGLPVNVLKTEARSGLDAQVTSISVPSSLYT